MPQIRLVKMVDDNGDPITEANPLPVDITDLILTVGDVELKAGSALIGKIKLVDENGAEITTLNPLDVVLGLTDAQLRAAAVQVELVNTTLVLDPVALAAGAQIVGKVGIDQTTPGTTNKVVVEGMVGGTAQPVSIATAPALVASEAHVGQFGGLSVPVSATPAIAAGLFHAGDNVGAKLTFTNAMRINGGSGTLQRLFIVDTSNQKAPLELVIFSQNPTVATMTDNAAFVFSTDIQYCVARLTIPTQDWVTINGIGILSMRNLGIPIVATGNQRNLYGGLVTLVSPPTYTLNCLRVDLGIYND